MIFQTRKRQVIVTCPQQKDGFQFSVSDDSEDKTGIPISVFRKVGFTKDSYGFLMVELLVQLGQENSAFIL